jgi:hypothetical protein
MKRFPLLVCLGLLLLVVTVIPATASPVISGISPATAPNNGDVTVTITGTGFNARSTVWLDTPYGLDGPIHGTIVSWSPTSITCTFSLKSQTPTQYNVWVNSPFISPVNNNLLEDVGYLPVGFRMYPVTVTTATTTTTPTPAYGNIRVSSIPSGANIYLDNEYKGLTTLTLKNVENGNHVLIVRLTGYQDWTENVMVQGNSQSLSARLAATPVITSATTTIPKIYITDTTPVAPVQKTKSPTGIELGIIATTGVALLGMKRK